MLYLGSVFLRHYPNKGDRQDFALAIGGFRGRNLKWPEKKAMFFISNLADEAEDEEAEKRVKAVRTSYHRLRAKRGGVYGLPKLEEYIGPTNIKKISRHFHLNVRSKDPDDEPQYIADWVSLDHVKMKNVKWHWENFLAAGGLTQIYGESEQGKSLLCLTIAAIYTKGGPWPFGGGNAPLGSVIVIASEDDVEEDIKPRLLAAGADMKKVHYLNSVKTIDGKIVSFNIQEHLPLLEQKIKEIGDVKLIIIDPIKSYLGTKLNTASETHVRSVTEPLKKWAKEMGVSMLFNGHPRKSKEGSAKDALSESTAFLNVPRIASIILPDAKDEARKMVIGVKNNRGSKMRFAYRINSWREKPKIPVIEWDYNPVLVNADEAMAALAAKIRRGTAGAQSRCRQLLCKILENGKAVRVKRIRKVTEERNLNWNTMRMVAKDMEREGVLERRTIGYGRKINAWRLVQKRRTL
jgi:hypothetical protein